MHRKSLLIHLFTTFVRSSQSFQTFQQRFKLVLSFQIIHEILASINPIQTGGGGGGVPALTLNVYNFFKIRPNAAKLYEFF